MKTALILGAGFSVAVGAPTTNRLFDVESADVRSQSDRAAENNSTVAWAYQRRKAGSSSVPAEEWLRELYEERDNPLQEMLQGTTWARAVRFALARLVSLPKGSNSHYYYGICTPNVHPVHQKFWRKIGNEIDAKSIVTLNYDILVEQALHDDFDGHRAAPNCRYGGFSHSMVVRKMTDVTKKKFELEQLGDQYVLYKLHGSLNWAWERHSKEIKVHDDVRAVFRHGDDIGEPAIIPPIPEKEMPSRFSQIWLNAREALLECPRWILCGYSLPEYDHALVEYFREVLCLGHQRELVVLDPYSEDVSNRWRTLAPSSLSIRGFPGLPEALEMDWTT